MVLACCPVASSILFAASDAGIFACLDRTGEASLAAIADACGLDERGGRLLLDGCVAVGLLEKTGDLYRNAPDVAAFLVTGRHGNTSYYLHGGTELRYRNLSPSDLLMADAIDTARKAGCSCFNFMSSPPKQVSLVRYKEKWGAETRQQKTFTAKLAAIYPLFRASELIHRLVF